MTAPKLRFKEFDGDWTLQNLGDSFSLISGYAFPSSSSVDVGARWLKIADVGIQEMTPNNPSYLPLEYLDKYSQFIVSKNDYVIALTRPILNKKLKIAKVGELYDGALLNQRVAKIYSKTKDLDFIYSLLQKSKTVEELENSIAGTDPPNLSLNDVKEIKLGFPSKEEQMKIASFLTAVDEKISQLSQKLHLLGQYKQGMMQKLFSQQLRFKADDGSEFGEWSNKTIGDVANIKRGASPRPINDSKWFDDSSSIGWVRISDVSKSKKYLLQTEQYLSTLGIQKSRLVPKGNLIMSICATIGKPIYTGFDVCIHDGFVVFSELQAIHEYAYYYLEYIEKNWYQYGQPGTQVNLNSDIVSNEAFPFPCLEEQTKIANFLSAIDQKIDVVSEQLEQAKLWKKGLLQQMFV